MGAERQFCWHSWTWRFWGDLNMTGELLFKCSKCKYELAITRLEAITRLYEAHQKKLKGFVVKCPKCGSEMKGDKEWQT